MDEYELVKERLADPASYAERAADEQTLRDIEAEIAAREEAHPWRSPSEGYAEDRSIADHAARVAIHEAGLRELYHRGEAAIAEEAARMLRAGKTEAQVARWSVEARNALRRAIREQGEPIIDAIAGSRRGAWDMPSYETLRTGQTSETEGRRPQRRPKTDKQIVAAAARSNARVDKWAGRLRIAGRITIAVEFGIGIYNIAAAPAVERPRVLAREVGRAGGAVSGGWAGAALGAKACAWGGAWGMGICGLVGGVAGAWMGGEAGEEVADWAIDELYPPSQTQFERDDE